MMPTDKPAATAPASTGSGPGRAGKRSKATNRPARRATTRAKPARRANKNIGPRRGSKTAKILTLLRRPGGASLDQIRKATGWQAHSVRGFLSGALKKKMGLRIDSAQRDGQRVYRVAAK